MNITSVCLFSRILRGSEVTGEPTICFLEHEPRVVLSLDLALPGPRHGLPREALLALHPLVSSASVSCSCKDDLSASLHHFHRVQCFKLLLSQIINQLPVENLTENLTWESNWETKTESKWISYISFNVNPILLLSNILTSYF